MCTASGTGYTVNETLAVNGSRTDTASAAWVGYPSSCTWTASGVGGTSTHVETMTTTAPVSSGVTYIHTDGLGSPVARTNAAGQVISRTRYEPYGYVADGAQPTVGFTGHVNDADTGLTYMQQRYYDPVAGRFLSIDPVAADVSSGEGFNRYSYANNRPYRYIDPDGRDESDPFDPPLTPAPPLPVILPPLPGLPPVGQIAPPIVVTVAAPKLNNAFETWVLNHTVAAIYNLEQFVIIPVLRVTTAPGRSIIDGIKQASRPPGAVDAIRGAREWGKRNGVKPDRAVDIFHNIKGGNRGRPGSGAKDDCSIDPSTGDIFDNQGEHIGNHQ